MAIPKSEVIWFDGEFIACSMIVVCIDKQLHIIATGCTARI